MPKPSFIVEGYLEQRMVQAACPGAKVVLLGANGDNVSMGTIAKFIATQFRLFNNRYYPIVVIFDREKRNEPCTDLKAELCKQLKSKRIDAEQFIFFISDRDIETIFVCHVALDGEIIDTGCPHTQSVDGLDGEAELRRRLERKGIAYHKTTIGIQLFRRVRPFIVAAKSDNFRAFRGQILGMCPWAAL